MDAEKIILDTNVLLEAVKRKIALFDQIKESFPESEIVTPKAILRELVVISKTNAKDSVAAKIVLKLIEKNNVVVKRTKLKGDESLIELCDKHSIVVTQDKELRKMCKGLGFRTGYIRERRYLIFD